MLFWFSLISRYFLSLMTGWFTPIFPSKSERIWILTPTDPDIVRRISVILPKNMNGFFQKRNLYPASWLYGKCIWSFHTCRLTSSGRSYSENHLYEYIKWKHAKSAPAGIHITSPEKELDMKYRWCVRKTIHTHFLFWQNARYEEKNSSYQKSKMSKAYVCCWLIFLYRWKIARNNSMLLPCSRKTSRNGAVHPLQYQLLRQPKNSQEGLEAAGAAVYRKKMQINQNVR